MPIYTYECAECSGRHERLEGVTAGKDELKCPACGSGKVKKVFSTFNVGKSAGPSRAKMPSAPSCSSCCNGSGCGL
ncbi:MAG: zinc ribbon domain-containing protein [Elusimicrobia bacterium]|nr:zinc ribbon domain-containing protein [Elusimicrobiota bacterium]